jgi:hypothetical protein
MKSLPARPSLDSLRKQAKKLARDAAAGNADALARVRAHLPRVEPPVTLRNAQLVVAREYGYQGWHDLTEEVHRRVGDAVEWAATQAHRAIHDNDIDRLKQLVAEYPALLSWQRDDDHDGLLGFATGAYGDAFGEERERWFTRRESAELLIDAGAVVTPGVVNGLLESHAVGLLKLFERKGLLPPTLKFAAALGDLDAVRDALGENDLAQVNEAFIAACGFHHEAVAALLLDGAIALDPSLGAHIDASTGREAFVQAFMNKTSVDRHRAISDGLWQAFVASRVEWAAHTRDLPTFVDILTKEPWLLAEDYVWLQRRLIQNAAQDGLREFIVALFELEPAILRVQPPPPSQAFEFALTYGHTDLFPLLSRVWPVPDDLPHTAGLGNLPRVRQLLADSSSPPQRVLDEALAYAVINHRFDVADVLLAHGADINTTWGSHEPASILHQLVFADDYEAMQYLIDRGIDMSIKDYRWNSNAIGWARYGKSDPQMALWLEQAERLRASGIESSARHPA